MALADWLSLSSAGQRPTRLRLQVEWIETEIPVVKCIKNQEAEKPSDLWVFLPP